MDFDDYEQLPTANVTTHMMAGAFAGVMEHCVMYPVDSIKTRMQSLAIPGNSSMWGVYSQMVTEGGFFRPFRGAAIVICGAGPAHALYFSCYEALKTELTKTSMNSHLAFALSGGAATFLHDGVMTPVDVVKQRLQMYNSPYQSIGECARNLYQLEGVRAFYRSFSTQLVMNIPFQSIHFVMYEFWQSVLNHDRNYNPVAHCVAGGLAGGTAAAVTTPLDVCKTLLNTQQSRTKGLLNAVRKVYAFGGLTAFFRGLSARVFHTAPSTAICWSIYELFKYILTSGSITTTDSDLIKTVKTESREKAAEDGSDIFKPPTIFTPLGITSSSRVLE